jgi:hypothetical protein
MQKYPENINELEQIFRNGLQDAMEECDDRIWNKLNSSLEQSGKINKLEKIVKVSVATNAVLVLFLGFHVYTDHINKTGGQHQLTPPAETIIQYSRPDEDSTSNTNQRPGVEQIVTPLNNSKVSADNRKPAPDKSSERNNSKVSAEGENIAAPQPQSPVPASSAIGTSPDLPVGNEVLQKKHTEITEKKVSDFYQKYSGNLKTSDSTRPLFIPK